MAKLNEVLKSVLIKAGYAANDPSITELLANEQIGAIEVNDDVSEGLNSRLISMEAAKNHPEIGKVYRIQTLDTIDKKISNVLDILEVDEDSRAKFLGETNTYKRLDNLNELIKAAKTGKADATNPADKKAHSEAIATLNEQLRMSKAELENEKVNFQNARKNDLKNFSLKGKIKNFKTILDGTNETAKFATCNTVIDSLLQEYKAELVADENGELVLKTKTGEDVYNPKTNTVIKADEFLELALAQNKLLKVAETVNPASDNGGFITAPITGQPIAATDKTAKAASDFNAGIFELISKQPK